MYPTHKVERKNDDYDTRQKDSYRKGKENNWTCFEKGDANTPTNYTNLENSTRIIPDLCTHFDYGARNCCQSDITFQDTCTCGAHEETKNKWLNCEFSESCSNIDSGCDPCCYQTEDIASSHIFTMEKECHSTFKHGSSNCIRCKCVGHGERDMMDTNGDERIPVDQGGRNRSSLSQSSVHGSKNIGPKTNVDEEPAGECKGESKESLQHSNTVEHRHLDENEGPEKTLEDDKPSDVNKQDLLKHLGKWPKRTNRSRKKHVSKKPGNLPRESIRNVQDMVGEANGVWAWALLVFGLLEQGLYMMLAAFPVWIGAGNAVLCYLLVLGVLSVFPVICWLGTCMRWVCVSVLSKARAIRADFNAFLRQRRSAYESSEHQHRPGHSGLTRDTSPAQQPFKEENMEADKIISHLLSSKHLNAYSILGVSREASDDEIKRKYREMAKIVHPDKNPNEKSGEAFQVLQSAFESISDQERRMVYQFESDKRKFEEEFENFVDLMANHVNELKSKIMCSNCNKPHPRLLKDRLVDAARYCARCDARHAAKEGDVWVETSHMGFKYYCYICLDNQVYEVTEWGACQGLLINNRANAHGVYLSVKSNRPSCSPWDDLLGESDQPTQPHQNKKKRHKNRTKGGGKNKKR